MSRRSRLLAIVVISVIALGAVTLFTGIFDSPESIQKRKVYDETVNTEIEHSTNLTKDRERMWKTVPGIGPNSSQFEVSPVSAINAASRVFATVQLIGKTQAEVIEILGVQPREKYGYNFAFHPTLKENMVYRFDCGSYGWQFNIVFDKERKVTEVQREWIH